MQETPQWVPIMDLYNAIFSVCFQVVFAIVILVRAKEGYRSSSYAFFHFDPSFSGWNAEWTFFLGILPPIWVSQRHSLSERGLSWIC